MQGLGSSKAPDAFRTISEVAEDLDIPQHVLRFWETKFTAIRPLKRAGGRRYYRPDDVDLLKGIRLLLYGKGYTIKGVQRILKEDGPRIIQQVGRDGVEPSPPPARPADLRIEEPDHSAQWEPVSSLPALPAVPGDQGAFDDFAERTPTAAPMVARSPLHAPPTIAQLRTVLADLYECRRLLHSTKASGA